MTTAKGKAEKGAAGKVSGVAVASGGKADRRNAKAVKVTTPWGQLVVVDEVKVAQQAGDKRFATVVQLLESSTGETLVRIAYTNDGIARRGPVTLRPRDIARLNAVLGSRPRLAEALGWGGGVE